MIIGVPHPKGQNKVPSIHRKILDQNKSVKKPEIKLNEHGRKPAPTAEEREKETLRRRELYHKLMEESKAKSEIPSKGIPPKIVPKDPKPVIKPNQTKPSDIPKPKPKTIQMEKPKAFAKPSLVYPANVPKKVPEKVDKPKPAPTVISNINITKKTSSKK